MKIEVEDEEVEAEESEDNDEDDRNGNILIAADAIGHCTSSNAWHRCIGGVRDPIVDY